MRTDHSTLPAVLDGFETRVPSGDGDGALREPKPFAAATPVDIDLDVQELGQQRDLFDTLTARRSTLQYSQDPVPTKILVGQLQEALVRDSHDWGLDEAAGSLEAFVFALRSADLPAGVYRVTAQECSHVASLDTIGDPENLGVQREFVTGGGVVTVFGNLDHADSWAGSHGYRLCLVRAAMVTYDFHLKFQSRGFVGTIFGGFIASSVRAAVQSDGVSRHALLSTTYAYPPRT